MWSRTHCGHPTGGPDLVSQWGAAVNPSRPVLERYPRPQMVRGNIGAKTVSAFRDAGDETNWVSLNGLWEWERASSAPWTRFDVAADSGGLRYKCMEQNTLDDGFEYMYNEGLTTCGNQQSCCRRQRSIFVGAPPFGRALRGFILVPFPVESCLSGVAPSESRDIPTGMWYRLTFFCASPQDSNVLLHFGAVDWRATVFLNNVSLGSHTGGYDGFSFDVTSYLVAKNNELLVHVYDPGDAGPQPNGKQRRSAMDSPGGDTYTPSSGIWQTVWLEQVPRNHVKGIKINQASQDTLNVQVDTTEASYVNIQVLDGENVVAESAGVNSQALDIDVPAARLWSPEDPHLYDLRVTAGADVVLAYAGLRTFALGPPGSGADGSPKVHVELNGQYSFLVGFLDQSYWPDGQYTAPSDEALEFDIRAVKMFGANMIRLHQKVNPERWYYHADRHGVLVFQDAVQKYTHASADTVKHFVADLTAMITGRSNHPSIVQWVAFNEEDCYAVFRNKPYDVAGIVDLVRRLDTTRLVDTNSGGKANDLHIGDVNDLHGYPYPNTPKPSATQYALMGEWGGFGIFTPGKEWVPGSCYGYLQLGSSAEAAAKYLEMTKVLEAFVDQASAAVYTQVTDVELECDGFLNYDRTMKFNSHDIEAIRSGNADLIAASKRLPGITTIGTTIPASWFA